MRFFNTAGPNMPELHYCIPALERLDLDEVLRLVRDKKYFMLHAPRQTGKTSVLFALQGLLTRQGYHCLYVTVEEAGTGLEDVEQAVRTVLDSLAYAARDLLGDPFLSGVWVGILAESGPKRALRIALQEWAKASPKPLVLLIDEIDALQGETLFSVLQQLRAGYSWRSEAFPQSVVLCGMRDVRNYRSTGSPFNIVAKSLRLGDFSQEETLALLGQHTAETGQAFTSEAQETVWEQTLGQPWLVNALAQEVCFESAAGRERSRAVTGDDIADARERLILGRVTHLVQLAYRLEEDRVRRVIEPLLSGDNRRAATVRDTEYLRDLGLIAKDAPMRIANPIYAEVIPRELTFEAQDEIEQDAAWYVGADGGLDTTSLMEAFQTFFRENSEHWKDRFAYPEAWPQLLLQAFLQRVLNGGGRIEREYGLGRGRTDLLIVWPKGSGAQKFVVECKMLRGSLEATIAAGLEQVAGYMDRCAAETGHLVIFDRDEKKPWSEKVFRRSESNVEIWGM